MISCNMDKKYVIILKLFLDGYQEEPWIYVLWRQLNNFPWQLVLMYLNSIAPQRQMSVHHYSASFSCIKLSFPFKTVIELTLLYQYWLGLYARTLLVSKIVLKNKFIHFISGSKVVNEVEQPLQYRRSALSFYIMSELMQITVYAFFLQFYSSYMTSQRFTSVILYLLQIQQDGYSFPHPLIGK